MKGMERVKITDHLLMTLYVKTQLSRWANILKQFACIISMIRVQCFIWLDRCPNVSVSRLLK